MNLPNQKRLRLNHTNLFVAISFIMCLTSVLLTFKLLTNECHCPRARTIIKHVEKPGPTPFSAHRLAVLVPFRDRFEELLDFVPHMHRFLTRQGLSFEIFVLHQVDGLRFNRASLINVGYLETKPRFDYVAMHDVDLLPLNDALSYAYPAQPRHVAAPELHPRYHYAKFIGGILLMNRDQFGAVGGLSNRYWGWGLEDDEFYVRLKDAKLNVTRPEGITTGSGDTFRHVHGKKRKRDTIKCHNQREVTRKRDRQTGLHDVKYKIVDYKLMTIDGAQFNLINIELACNRTITPWCDCSEPKS